MVTSKHNDDKQHIWESNGGEFTIAEDPRGASLLRGTTVRLLCTQFLFIHFSLHHFSLFMKEEAQEFLDQSTLKELIRKYSQFINFPIYLWDSKTETVEEPIEVSTSFIPHPYLQLLHTHVLQEDEEAEEEPSEKPETDEEDDEEIEVEEEKEEKPKTKKVKYRKRHLCQSTEVTIYYCRWRRPYGIGY